jgi:hypothetical protein
MSEIRIYKMTHDTGFAPNHYNGTLTLATCKEYIRRSAKAGEWIGGTTSQSPHAGSTNVGEEKLIFLMKVTEIITFADYWERYPERKPDHIIMGDNIYRPDDKGGYIQVCNRNHKEWDIATDLISDRVLVSTEFRYFGKDNPLDISMFKQGLSIPKGQARYGYITNNEHVDAFIDYVMKQQPACDFDYALSSAKNESSCSSAKNENSCSTGGCSSAKK